MTTCVSSNGVFVEDIQWRRSASLSRNRRRSLSAVASTRTVSVDDNEPTWPKNWAAYIALWGCWCLMFNSWGLVNTYGTFASFYKEHLLASRDLLLIGLIGSTECFMVLALSFATGRLLDAGYARYLLGAGVTLNTIGAFMLSLSSGDGAYNQGNYLAIWATQGLVQGLGMACFFVASSQIVSTHFPKRKSTAIGIVATGASIAGLVYPFMIKYLISSLGWSRAVQAVGGVIGITSIMAFFGAIPNPNHPLKKGDDGLTWTSTRRWVDPPAFRVAAFNWTCAGIALMFLGFYAIFFNLEEWAAVKGFGYKDLALLGVTYHNGEDMETPHDGDALRTFIYLAIMNGASTVGRISSGWLADKYGALNVHFTVIFTSSMLVLFFWTFASTVPEALAFVNVFGAISGAVIGLPPATVADIIHNTPGVDHSRMGHWTGMMYTIAAIPALIGPVIAGHLITKFDTYLTVQMWSGTCLFLSSLCLGAAMYCMRRTVAKERKERASSMGFESGAVTATNSRPVTQGGKSDEEKEKDEEKV